MGSGEAESILSILPISLILSKDRKTELICVYLCPSAANNPAETTASAVRYTKSRGRLSSQLRAYTRALPS
jgi:hypothetical protein